MEEIMLVEGIGDVTFQNGIIRVQLLSTNASGKVEESCAIEIPGNKIADLINGLAAATQGISNKLNENTEIPEDSNGKSSDKKASSKSKKDNKKTKK